MKRLISIALVFLTLISMTSVAFAATSLSSAPYAKVEYSYTTSTPCGTIRYISQLTSSGYFNWNYWPASSFGGYASPGSECGTASISMALSYIGINKTPKDILNAHNGYTYFGDNWGGATSSSPSLSTAINNFVNGNGKYSPPIIHLPSYSAAGHYVIIAGKISSSQYSIVNPAADSVGTMTISGTSWSYNGKSGSIDQVYQYYNPNASITHPVLNIGDDFYALIISQTAGSWLHLEADPVGKGIGNVQIASNGNNSFDPKQIWHFTRQNDGSYKITNEYNGLCMEGANWGTEAMTNVCTYTDNNVTCQRWYISGEEDYYTITPQYTSDLVLDVLGGATTPGTNVELYPPNGSSTQQFSIYNLKRDGVTYSRPNKPTASSITSVVSDSNTTTITWSISPENGKYDTRVYDLRIWKGVEVTDFDNTYVSVFNLGGNSYNVHLDDGTYTIMVTAKNDKYYEFYTFGAYKTVTLNSHIHNYVYAVTNDPSISSSGVAVGRCSCGDICEKILPKLNSTDYAYSVIKVATCTATGIGRYTWKTTTYGTFYFDVTIAKTAHTYKDTVTAPTCTAQGYTTHTCSGCSDSYIDTYTAALGHSYSYKVTTTPTTSAAGKLTGTCTRSGCGATTTVTLPKLNTTDYNYSVVKAASCTATGTGRYTWKTTTYGSFYFDVTLAKIAHNYKATVTAPTCTEKGYTTHTCTACGDSYVTDYTGALGHNWDSGVITTQPTETSEGVKTFTCSRCGATRTETVPATGSFSDCGGNTASCPSAKFTDVAPYGNWSHNGIDFCLDRGLFGGTSATTFEPNTAMNRAMLVTVLWRYQGSPKGYTNDFRDVVNGEWYADAVSWAAANGIVNGVEDGRFDPDGIVTREQMATILYRYSDWKGFDTSKQADFSSFPDAGKVGSWAKTAMQWAVAENLIGGSEEGGKTYILPADGATRAQVATILMRFIQSIAEK